MRRQPAHDVARGFVDAFGRVHQNQRNIGILHRFFAALDTDFFHHVVGLPQTGGVGNVNGHAVQCDLFAHRVARGAGNIGHNRHIVARQSIEQAGFAHIRRTHQHHAHTVAQNRTLPCIGQNVRQLCLQRVQFAFRIGRFQKIDVFFGKIQRGFHQHPQRD